jgi:DNA-binding NtrC family response regulator
MKNLVEQISVLETNREISADTLLKYLPETSTLPALVKDRKGGEEFIERDLLYKILFDMKKDMNELKKLVLNMLHGISYGAKVISDHKDLFDGVHEEQEVELHHDEPVKAPYLLGSKESNEPYVIHPPRHRKIEDIQHEQEEESLSLEDKEKEMILKALKKNNNKRKYAARDLGISERTLYRKIKQYSIEE